MGVNLWKFQVIEGCDDDFLSMNRKDWPELLGASPDYLGTDITRSSDDPHTYLTTDKWKSRAGFDAFMAGHKKEYEDLSARHYELCVTEEHIGFFEDPL